MKKIRVMQLGSPAGLYGAERWILALIRYLDPAKIESLVAAVKDEPGLGVPLCSRASEMGFQTHAFNCPGKANPDAVKAVRDYIKKEGIDILHTHAYKQDIIGLFATRGLHCRLVSTPHGWSRDAGFKLQCYELANRMVFPFFDAVVPLSKELYSPLAKLPFMKHRLHLIQNGVDTDEILETSTVDPEISALRQQGYFILGYIGQLIHRKGIDILLKALAASPGRDRIRLILVGEGEERAFLEQMAVSLKIEDRVHFMGFRQNRLALLNGFDAFVLPSRLEGIPRCLMEAMTAGIPVIASDIPGCTDLVTDRGTGILFEKDSVNGLIKAISTLREDRPLAKTLASSGRQKVMADYSAVRMAREYTALFLSLAGSDTLKQKGD